MNLVEKYDDLESIIISLDLLTDNINYKDYVWDLQEIKYRAEKEKEEIEEDVLKILNDEEKYMNYEYERSVL